MSSAAPFGWPRDSTSFAHATTNANAETTTIAIRFKVDTNQ